MVLFALPLEQFFVAATDMTRNAKKIEKKLIEGAIGSYDGGELWLSEECRCDQRSPIKIKNCCFIVLEV